MSIGNKINKTLSIYTMNLEDLLTTLHVISMISWMCGMLYLPRLFVYHTEAKTESEMYSTFCVMEKKLLKIIINPAMFATLFFGFSLAVTKHSFEYGYWLHAKLTLVLIMTGLHGLFSWNVKQFRKKSNKLSGKFFRIINEVVAFFMCVIVFLAISKPF